MSVCMHTCVCVCTHVCWERENRYGKMWILDEGYTEVFLILLLQHIVGLNYFQMKSRKEKKQLGSDQLQVALASLGIYAKCI